MILAWLRRYWRGLLAALILGGAFLSGSWFGAHQANTAWALKWKQRDADDATALAKRQAEARAEEQRRQGEIDAIERRAEGQLLRPLLMLTMPALFLTGCMTKPQNSPRDWQQVNAPAVPQLPAEARQAPPAANCLPSCSAALTSERESWRQLLIRQGLEG